MSRARAEVSGFLLVGAVNFVFTFAIFTFALKGLGLDHHLALLLAWVAGNMLTYVLNFLWVFRPEPRLTFGWRFVTYLATGGVSVAINLGLLFLLVDLGGHDAFWSQVAAMPVVIVLNFVSAKFVSLRKTEEGS